MRLKFMPRVTKLHSKIVAKYGWSYQDWWLGPRKMRESRHRFSRAKLIRFSNG
jgi:hypothetical protein